MKVANFGSRRTALPAILGLLVSAASAFAQPATTGDEDSAESEELAALERQVEAAYLGSDVALLRSTLREDFRFSHGTGEVAGKDETLANFAKAGNFLSRTLTSVEVELHGDVALTRGRIEVRSARPTEYTICYVRLYQRRDGPWQLVSHRTVRQASGFAETCSPN